MAQETTPLTHPTNNKPSFFNSYKREWISFLMTLIATLAGVLIAVVLTNAQTKSKEKQDAIKLLETAVMVLENTHEYTARLNQVVKDIEKDTLNYTQDDIDLVKVENPIPYPYLSEEIIANDLIAKNISKYTHRMFYTGLINIKKIAKYETADYYEQYLKEIIRLLQLEIKFQNEEITLVQLQQTFESFVDANNQELSSDQVLEVE